MAKNHSKSKLGFIIMAAVAFVMVLVIIISVVVGTQTCGKPSGDDPSIDAPAGDGEGGGNNGGGSGDNNGDNGDNGDATVKGPVVLPTAAVVGGRPTPSTLTLLGTPDSSEESSVEQKYPTVTSVGFHSEIVDDAEQRVKPVEEVKNYGEQFGNAVYPTFGTSLRSVLGADKSAARTALIKESSYLTATGTANAGGGGYTWMDANGLLYSGTRAEPVPTLVTGSAEQRQLYKHSASVGLYGGDVADNEKAVIKKVTMRPRGYNGYGVTGVYAPAGEVIKIEMSDKDMEATGGIVIHIGQALYNGQANNIWAGKNQMPRIPHLLNTMQVNKNYATYDESTDTWTAYVGSFIGGPIYIRNESVTFTATITGGVEYPHFILGYTTPEDYARTKQSSAPYFDLEVWHNGVLHSGPRRQAERFSYDELYRAAVLWDKVASVTTTGSNQGIVFLYEPFVAAGAAVAFPGRSSVNCPEGWMASSLNYNAIVTSGSWGNFHEYHHNFQGYGVGNGGEVTNNGLNLVSYALFTKVSSARGISNFGAAGMSGWNRYTSASWALEDVLKIGRDGENPSNGNKGLSLYATLLHNFGADNYIKAKVAQRGGQNYQAYMEAWQNTTHNNMSYYFNDILKGGVKNNAPSDYPMFVPVSSVYQTGRSYMYGGVKQYFNTMQPFVIPYGEDFTIDLTEYTEEGGMYRSGSVVIPEGFKYRVKSVTAPENGTVEIVDDYHFKYVPNPNAKSLRSGQIIATLEITKDDGEFKVDDVDLVLEFEQSHETKKTVLERTTYSYDAETMYADADEAFKANFAGASDKVEQDHSNPTQNCNTDIWFYPDNEENRKKYPNAPEHYFVHDNTIEVIDGKLYFENTGKYRIYLRGRLNCALYFSLDGKNYTLGATIKDKLAANGKYTVSNSHLFRPNDANTYFDIEFRNTDDSNTFEYIVTNYDGEQELSGTVEGYKWLYLKEVLIVQSKGAISYIGVGMKQWTEPQYTMHVKYYRADGTEITTKYVDENGVEFDWLDHPEFDHTETFYYDNNGNQVPENVAVNATYIEPTFNSKNQPYVNVNRNSYQFPDNSLFETDYYYFRNYSYTYSDTYNGQSIVGDPKCPSNFPIENLFDDDPATACGSPSVVSPSAPWELTVDMGKVIEANRFELTGRLNNNALNQNQTPNSITLWLGETLDDMKEVMSFDNGNVDGIKLKFNFQTTKFRYYKLQVRKTVQGRFANIGKIDFIYNLSGGMQITPSNGALIYGGDWEIKQETSSFGNIYLGSGGATLSFDMNGKRLGILASAKFGKDFEVYIDEQKVDSLDINPKSGDIVLSYLSPEFTSGKHKVKIKCLTQLGLDSILIYN